MSQLSCTFRVASFALVLGVGWAGLASPVHAQEREAFPVRLGSTELYPALRLEYRSNDNVFADADDPVEAGAFVVSPELSWQADRRLMSLNASYDGTYSTSDEDLLSYDDHSLGFSLEAEPSTRIGLLSSISFLQRNEQRELATPTADGIDTDLYGRNEFSFRNELRYGANNARGNIRVGLYWLEFDPDNGARFLSPRQKYSRVEPYGRFSLRISPDTRAFVEARYSEFSYENAGSDNTRLTGLVGLSFTATGKLGGSVSVGATQIDYAGDFQGDTAVASAGLFYLPVSYSRFDLTLRRDVDNAATAPDDADDEQALSLQGQLAWRHDYSSRVFHRVRLSIDTEERGCPAADEATTFAGVELGVYVRRWLELGVGGGLESRSVDGCASSPADSLADEYDRTRLNVHLRATL